MVVLYRGNRINLTIRIVMLLMLLLAAIEIVYLNFLKNNEEKMEELKKIQQSLTFLKPERVWNYSNKWQYIGDPYYREQVYSAYYDPRTELYNARDMDENHIFYGSIRVFAILPLRLTGTIQCNIRYEDNFTELVNAHEGVPINEHFFMYFSAYTIMCPLRTQRDATIIHLPESVAIIHTANPQSQDNPTYVPISYSKDNIMAKPDDKLAICVGPLQKNYSEVLRMVEFIEVYRLLGADKFYFYRLDVAPDIDAVLSYYNTTKYVQVNEWNFHGYKFEYEVRYGGILAEFNECIYRATFIDGFKYVAVVDLDEILMPLKFNTLLEYIRAVEDKRTSAFVFRNVFFHNKAADDMASTPDGVRNRFLYTQVKVRRTTTPLRPHDRSKCIVNARANIEMGNHQTWRSVTGTSESNVHIRDGLLFHYRNKCINCKGEPLLVDFTARRFGSKLWTQVEQVCANAFPMTGVCPVNRP